MSDQYMMLGMPSAGTNWMASVIARACPRIDYYGWEFFNPITNMDYYDRLAEHFGCELPETMHNIARPSRGRESQLDQVFDETWKLNRHNFTKEVFHVFQAQWLSTKFDLFFLYRDWRETFPPRRLRVIAWYNAIWCSIVQNREECDNRPMVEWFIQLARTLPERVFAAHFVCYHHLFQFARDYGRPALSMSRLMSLDQDSLVDYLAARLPNRNVLDPVLIAATIIRDRDPAQMQRDRRFLHQWAGVSSLADMAMERWPMFAQGVQCAEEL